MREERRGKQGRKRRIKGGLIEKTDYVASKEQNS